MNKIKKCDAKVVSDAIRWLETGSVEPKCTFVGFDGYIDYIYHVVKQRNCQGDVLYFQRIEEYAARLMQAAGKSADIEIIQNSCRIGGNAPLLAEGLAALEQNVDLIGTLGWPVLHACFEKLPANVHAYSYARPCETTAFEFMDGKLMHGCMFGNENVSWNEIESAVGINRIKNCVDGVSLITLLNWSANLCMPQIALKVFQMAEKLYADKTLPWFFFDISDPNALNQQRLQSCLSAMDDIGKKMPTTLGMNENEARIVFLHAFSEADTNASTIELAEQYGPALIDLFHLDMLFIHATSYALGLDAKDIWYTDGYAVEKPRISTGGGDHFNAAFCFGMIHGLPMQQCLLLGRIAASFYVQNGVSANRENLLQYLHERE